MSVPGALRGLDALALWGVCAVLAAAFGEQFLLRELPCPLCILQRAAFVLVGFAFALNVRFGAAPAHYGLAVLAALAGAAASTRQVLLHIAPGSKGYGSALFGLHLYTWALVGFLAVIVFCGLMLLASSYRAADGGPRWKLETAGLWLLLLLTAGNALSTYAECGPGACPDNPVRYLRWPPF